jgi:predicted nucleic acid-binding Zn ribbon protein
MNQDRKSNQATPIGDIIGKFIRQTEEQAVKPMQLVRNAWEAVCKEKRIYGTRVVTFQEGKVAIEVKSPPLCAELAQFRRRELLEEMQRRLVSEPQVKELRFRLGAW